LLVDSIPKCMPSGTRSNKEKDLLFSDDPAHLKRTIRRGQRSTSLDATTLLSIDTHNQQSTDTRPSSSIDPNQYESEYETEYSESIDTHTFPSINSNESTVTDDRNKTSLDVDQPVDHFTLPNHCYPHFAFQPPSKRARDDYSIGSCEDSGFHECFAVDIVITSPNEEHTEEYDDDYWKERAIEMSLQDERFETHKFTNTFPTSFDEVHSTSVDTHPRPAKKPLTSIDTHIGTSIDICAGAKIQEQENIPSPTRFIDTYLKRFAPLKPPPHTRADTQAEKMNTLPSISTGKSMKSNHLKNTISAEIILPSIDASVSTSIDTTLKPNLSISKLNNNANIDYSFLTPDAFGIFRDPDGNARAIDGRILQVSREDIADILQVANGPDNLFSQQRGTPDVIQTNPNKHVGVAATEINPYLSCQPKCQASIDGTTQTSIDRITPMSTDKNDQTSIDRRYEFGYRAFDMYRARKFTWERRDEYGVYGDECGHARGVAGSQDLSIDRRTTPSINVSLPTAQIPAEPQCSAEHKAEWEVSYINTRINDMYYPLNNNVDWLSTKIEVLQQDLDTIRKKDQQPATSIDVCTITSLDAKISAMDDRLHTYDDMHDRFANSFSIDRLRGPWINGKNPVESLGRPWIEETYQPVLGVVVTTTEVPIIRKGPTTRSGSRVIRAGFAKAVQELLAQEQTEFKQLLIQELSDLKLEDTCEPLEVPEPFHSSQFSSIGQNEAGLIISTFILNPSNQIASGLEI
ncbi:hypothetical protein IGI04_042153, partial [Brassica rapa subsp. trilocularis]